MSILSEHGRPTTSFELNPVISSAALFQNVITLSLSTKICLLNSIHYLLEQRFSNKASKQMKTMLEKYTEVHFLTEETLMKESHYPDLMKHKLENKEIVRQIDKLSNVILKKGYPDVEFTFLKICG